jgi:hypothetical protein
MATAYEPQPPQDAASAAQVRDLSSQVQVMQAQLTALRRRSPNERPRPIYPFLIAIALLAAACLALLLFPLRERTVVRYVPQVQVVHDVRTVPVVRVIHDVRTVPVVHVVHDVRVVVATPIPVARPAGGVSVCTDSGFDLAAALCTQHASQVRVSDLGGARVSYTGKNGGPFTAPQVTIALSQRNSAGSVSLIGRLPVDVLLASTSQASRLQGVFDALGAVPQPGSSYAIEVDQGDGTLGATSFTVVSDRQ